MKEKKFILLDIATFWDTVARSDEIQSYDFNIKGGYDYDGEDPDWEKMMSAGDYDFTIKFKVKNKKDKNG